MLPHCYRLWLKRLCSPGAPGSSFGPRASVSPLGEGGGAEPGPPGWGAWPGPARRSLRPRLPHARPPSCRPAPPRGRRCPRARPGQPRCYTDGGTPVLFRRPGFSSPSRFSEDPGPPRTPPSVTEPDAAPWGGDPSPRRAENLALPRAVRNQGRRLGFQRVGERRALPGTRTHVPRRARGRCRGAGGGCPRSGGIGGWSGPARGGQSPAPGPGGGAPVAR